MGHPAVPQPRTGVGTTYEVKETLKEPAPLYFGWERGSASRSSQFVTPSSSRKVCFTGRYFYVRSHISSGPFTTELSLPCGWLLDSGRASSRSLQLWVRRRPELVAPLAVFCWVHPNDVRSARGCSVIVEMCWPFPGFPRTHLRIS